MDKRKKLIIETIIYGCYSLLIGWFFVTVLNTGFTRDFVLQTIFNIMAFIGVAVFIEFTQSIGDLINPNRSTRYLTRKEMIELLEDMIKNG